MIATVLMVASTAATVHAGAIDPASAIAQKFSQADETSEAQRREAQRAADERDMLARARAEADARRAADAKAKAAAAPGPTGSSQTGVSPGAKPAATQQRQADAKSPPVSASTTSAKPAAPPVESNGRVSVLLVLNPGQPDDKRAASKSSPILCLQESCYTSAGPTTVAVQAPRAEAIHSGAQAGACNARSHCIYRGVTLQPASFIQIVDLGPAKLIRMETIEARPDKTCRMVEGTLVCEQPIAAPDYRMWLVPETVAEQAGPNELEAALADELPEENVTRVTDK